MSNPRSFGHGIRLAFRVEGQPDRYRISWWQRKPRTCQSVQPCKHSKLVDRAGAERFAKKWGCKMPENRD